MIHLKITRSLLDRVRTDLRRQHSFAFERVGFLTCRFARTPTGSLLILASGYEPVADEDYIDDPGFGALIGSAAFRKALQVAYSEKVGLFHVHAHDGFDTPKPSRIDVRESARFVPDFFNVQPRLPHGVLILSSNAIWGRAWLPEGRTPEPINCFSLVGTPMSKMSGA